MIHTFPTTKLVELRAGFRTRTPELRPEVVEGKTEELDGKLKDHKLDLLFTILDAPTPEFVEVRLFGERDMRYASSRSTLSSHKNVRLGALAGQAFHLPLRVPKPSLRRCDDQPAEGALHRYSDDLAARIRTTARSRW